MPNKIKIPKIRQLPSGAWTCQLRMDGKSLSITDDDYNIVVAKAYAYKSGFIKDKKSPKQITVGEALDKHIESLQAVRSPSTVRGYRKDQRNYFQALQKKYINSLTPAIIQREINEESKRISPKTLKNAWTLVAAAIERETGEKFIVKLPQVPPKEIKYLTPEQIPTLLSAVKGHKLEIPILLGLWSCRRSEIFGLRWENVDLENRQIIISEARVIGEDGKFTEKRMPKTKSSVRIIPISNQLFEALSAVEDKTGFVYDAPESSIYKGLRHICAENNLPLIGVHGLRHSFASLAYSLGLPAKITQQIGGWETDDVMMKIYTHISQKDVNAAAAEMLEFFDAASRETE